MVGRRGWRGIQKSVAVALALILMSSGSEMAIAASGQLTETPPPQAIQTLRRVLDQYQPQIKILAPKPGELFQDTTVSLVLQVKDLPIYQSAGLGLGPHLHVVVDDRPYQSVYDATQPIVLTDLAPGTHTIRVFAVRPWDESFKNDGSFAQTTFNVFTKTDDHDPDPRKPLLTYSQPQGNYGAEPILLDFYLTNAPLHFIAQDHPEDSTRDWKIKATVNGQSFLLDRWQPIYLKGVKPGKNWVQLEFIDENGTRVENFGNNTARIFNYTPNGTDVLSKLIRGELTIAQSKGIVDPTYRSPIEAIVPDVVPTIVPKAEPKAEPKIKSKVLPKAVTSVEPKVSPKIESKVESKAKSKVAPTIEPLPVGTVDAKPSGFRLPIVPIPLPIFGKKSGLNPNDVITGPEESKSITPKPETAKPETTKLIDLPRKSGQSDRRLLQSQDAEKPPAISKRNKPFQFFKKKEKTIEPISPIEAPRPSVPKPATLRQPLATMTKKAVKPEAIKPEAAVQGMTKPNVFFPPLTKPEPPTPQPKPAEPKTESQKIAPPPTLPSRFFPGQKVEVNRPAKVEPKTESKAEPKTEPKIKARIAPEIKTQAQSQAELKVESKSVPSSIASPKLMPSKLIEQQKTPVVPKAEISENLSPSWLDQIRDRLPPSKTAPTTVQKTAPEPNVVPNATEETTQEVVPSAKPDVNPAIEPTTIEPKAEMLQELVDRLNKTIAKPVIKPIVLPSTEPQITSDFTPQVKPDIQPEVKPEVKTDTKLLVEANR